MNRKKILLTGASRGIGKAIYELLSSLNIYTILAPTRKELDLLSHESVEAFVKKNNDIDILINNAGINIINDLCSTKDADINSMFLVNLISPIKLIRSVLAHMMEKKWGRVMNISSIWGVISKEKRTLYSATKFGLNGVTKALTNELGKYNILVNSICPGYVNTEMTKKNISEAEKEGIVKTIPLKRFAEPIEVAKLVKFLISDENTYITGQSIVIDGGFTA